MRCLVLIAVLLVLGLRVAGPTMAMEPETASETVARILAGEPGNDTVPATVPRQSRTQMQPSSLPEAWPSLAAKCCKICRKGKACGDSCIKRSYTCNKPPGCACDGN